MDRDDRGAVCGMIARRSIDSRDVDRLLNALTDVQISSVFGMHVTEVQALRRARRRLHRGAAARPEIVPPPRTSGYELAVRNASTARHWR